MRCANHTPARALLLAFLVCGPAAGQEGEYAKEDPAKIQTVEACAECHVAEYEVWKRTPHATGFKTLHRKAAAEQIAAKMDFPLIKRESLCLSCHYTPIEKGGQLRADSGVSCESCHGAGAEWIDLHNDYGGKGLDHRSESAEHRRERIEASRRAGMRRPSDLYEVAAACFSCHSVPHEELVNRGGHSTGSAAFELVAWSQGEIRHNFLASFLEGDGTENAERPVERKRLMYVTGRALDLEHSLRGMAAASGPGIYAKAMARRARSAVGELVAVAEAAELAEVGEMLAAARGVSITPGQGSALMAAAEKVEAATRRMLARAAETGLAGERLAALDPLLAGRAPAVAAAETSGAAASGAAPSGATSAAGSGVSGAAAFRTVGQAACSGCHAPQNGWWFEDPHFASAEPFLDREERNVEIARLYGLSPREMARGTSACMRCHGTAVSGRENREVQDGVACESCHGPAGAYLEPHREGDKALGAERPGYRRALELGMRELRSLEVRAEACTGCHYITDPKLIATGHPSGEGFDYAAGMDRVRHWERPAVPVQTLLAAFRPVLAARGPVPAKDPTLLTPVAVAADAPAAPVDEPAATSAAGSDSPAVSSPAASSQAGSSAGGVRRAVVGEKKRRVHPPSPFDVRGPGACSACHEAQNAWWGGDRHYAAADSFFAEDPKTIAIARRYGLASGEMTRGDQICMDCHGTIVAGRERREVQDGVGCESCHGPAGEYLEPHQQGDKALGLERPGYRAALGLGMVELKDLEVRAGTCTSCHFIREPRLISAGHPSGVGFDYAGGMARIRHWESEPAPAATLAAAFDGVLGRLGAPRPGPRSAEAGQQTREAALVGPLPPRPVDPAEPAVPLTLGGVEIPPLPKPEPGRPVEEVLLLVKERLELLYRAVREKGGEP